jgi:hypothetical protein
MARGSAAQASSSPQSPARRILFVRVGWMTYYAGSQADDERPRGGGRYNRENVGHELFNFADIEGRLYGFVRAKNGRINLERIDPAAAKSDTLDNVLVVFVARQRIIGWYGGALVHGTTAAFPVAVTNDLKRRLKRGATKNFKLEGYRFEVSTDKATLLPTHRRTHLVPGNVKGGFGQSNVRYPYNNSDKPKASAWIDLAIAYVLKYDKENLLTNPNAETSSEESATMAQELASGFQSSPEIRRAVELHAMGEAIKALKERGYTNFDDTSLYKSYDYTCLKDGTRFYVEVKGTQTAGKTVILTKKEVEHVKSNPDRCILVLVHSVILSGRTRTEAKGGTTEVKEQWHLESKDLTPTQYLWAVN